MNEPAIEAQGVKFLGEGAGKVEALEGVDLTVRQRGPGPRWLPAVAARRLASSRVRRLDAARRNRLSFSGFDERRPKSWSPPPQSTLCLGCCLVCYLGRAMTDALFALIIYWLPSVRSPPGSSFLDTAAPAMNAGALIRAMICAIALVMLILVVLNAARRR